MCIWNYTNMWHESEVQKLYLFLVILRMWGYLKSHFLSGDALLNRKNKFTNNILLFPEVKFIFNVLLPCSLLFFSVLFCCRTDYSSRCLLISDSSFKCNKPHPFTAGNKTHFRCDRVWIIFSNLPRDVSLEDECFAWFVARWMWVTWN